jgi:hypothetical protein
MYAAIGVDLGSMVFPTEDKLDFPAHGLTKREKVRRMIRAEKHLDDIWRKIDLSYMKAQPIDGKRLYTLFETSPVPFESTRTLMRSTPWQDPRKKVSVPTIDTRPRMDDVHGAVGLFKHDPTKDMIGILDKTQINRKIKVKIKGSSAEAEVEQAPTVDEATPEPDVLYMLKPADYKVFSTLFHNQSDAEAPNTVQWSSFIRAMGVLNFSIWKLQGSAWQFTLPESMGTQQPIQIHQPHSDTRFTLAYARRIGRRLNMTYGLTGPMFRSR